MPAIGISYHLSFAYQNPIHLISLTRLDTSEGGAVLLRLVFPVALGRVPATWSGGDPYMFVGILTNVYSSP